MGIRRYALSVMVGTAVAALLVACGGGSSGDTSSSSGETSESGTQSILSLSQVSDLPVVDLSEFDVRAAASSAQSIISQAAVSRSQDTGDASIAGCEYDALFSELARQSAIAAAYTCYAQTAAELQSEIKIGTDKYAYYSIAVPALSTGESVGAASELLVRVGKFDDTLKLEMCLNDALVYHYSVTADRDALALAGTVIATASTQSYEDIHSIAFDLTFASEDDVPGSGTFSYEDVKTAQFDIAFTGSAGEGEFVLDYQGDGLGDGVAALDGFATLVSPDAGDEVTAQLYALLDGDVATANYRVEGFYEAFSVAVLGALGVDEGALEDDATYCFDANVKALADAAAEAGAACDTANNPACYGLVESEDGSCDFKITHTASSFDPATAEFPVVDSSESPFADAVGEMLLSKSGDVTVSFGEDAWDCKTQGQVTDLNLALKDFSACKAYLKTAFPDALPGSCVKDFDEGHLIPQ